MGIYLGLISGTSMDAIDAALVDFDVAPLRPIVTSATRSGSATGATAARVLGGVYHYA